MRIPFVPKDVEIYKDRFDFIRNYRGGGYMLIAGSVYWFLTFILFYVLDSNILINYYIFGGMAVPIYGFIIYKLLGLKSYPSQYSSLSAFSSMFTVCCIPVLLLIKEQVPNMILPTLCIINAAHLLILCWIHLDYLYFILLILGECLGVMFMLSISSKYVHFIGLIWGIISLVFGLIIHITTKTPLQGYDYTILGE